MQLGSVVEGSRLLLGGVRGEAGKDIVSCWGCSGNVLSPNLSVTSQKTCYSPRTRHIPEDLLLAQNTSHPRRPAPRPEHVTSQKTCYSPRTLQFPEDLLLNQNTSHPRRVATRPEHCTSQKTLILSFTFVPKLTEVFPAFVIRIREVQGSNFFPKTDCRE
jgi:hypothetical protein